MTSLELKIPPVVLVLLLAAAMAAFARLAPALAVALPGRAIIVAGLAGAGVVVSLLGVGSFRRARTTVNPLDPAAASTLVVGGIYRRTRNPMYLGMLFVLLAWGVFLAHALAIAGAFIFVPVMNRLQIIPEEKALAARFGPGFADYQSRVRRWL